MKDTVQNYRRKGLHVRVCFPGAGTGKQTWNVDQEIRGNVIFKPELGFFREYQFELFENLGLNLGLAQKFSLLYAVVNNDIKKTYKYDVTETVPLNCISQRGQCFFIFFIS